MSEVSWGESVDVAVPVSIPPVTTNGVAVTVTVTCDGQVQAPEDVAASFVAIPALSEAEYVGFNMRDAVTVLPGPVSVVVQVLPPEVKVSVVRADGADGASVTGSLPIML